MDGYDARMNVAVVATSSVVPSIELTEGVRTLRDAGMTVSVAANCNEESFLFAGDDATRAEQFYQAACSESELIWCANGGYGAARLLPLLDRLPMPPMKTLIGYSDVTALLSFVRTRWKWRTIHAPMVASKVLADTLEYLKEPRSIHCPLQWITPPLEVTATIVGGNLAVWTSMIGTPFAEPAAAKMLFLEDVDEPPYRIDRLVTQLQQSGGLEDVAAIVLGAFSDCEDRVKRVRAASGEQVPLRRTWNIDEALLEIFGRLDVPVAKGLPVGHGGYAMPLPLGIPFRLSADGVLSSL